MTDVLSHYGVVGMKWGKRKSDFANPKSSKELVKEARTNFKTAMKPVQAVRIERMFGGPPVNYDTLSTNDVRIKKGQELARITLRKNEQLKDMTYLAYTKEDRTRYKAVLSSPTSVRSASRSYRKPVYESVYVATKALKSPSEKARVDAFVEILGTKSIPVGKKGEMITGREYIMKTGGKSAIKSLDNQQAGLKLYNNFTTMQYLQAPLNTAYFEAVRKKGYNALVDDNDRNILSDAPLMVLDTKGSIKSMYVKQLTNDDINTAIASITTPKNLKTVEKR